MASLLGLAQSRVQKGLAGAAGSITVDSVDNYKKCFVIVNTSGVQAYMTSNATLYVSGACYWYIIESGGAVVE